VAIHFGKSWRFVWRCSSGNLLCSAELAASAWFFAAYLPFAGSAQLRGSSRQRAPRAYFSLLFRAKRFFFSRKEPKRRTIQHSWVLLCRCGVDGAVSLSLRVALFHRNGSGKRACRGEERWQNEPGSYRAPPSAESTPSDVSTCGLIFLERIGARSLHDRQERRPLNVLECRSYKPKGFGVCWPAG